MEPPLVSIVVPAYNAEATLRRTLLSACKQTYRAVEVIVVDDGSTDGTPAIVSEFAASDSRVRLLSQSNSGVARARNSGLRNANGDFVAPLDADDVWHPQYIEKLLAALLAAGPSTAFAYSASRFIDADDRVLYDGANWGLCGNVLFRHVAANFIGNGRAMLARRKAMLEYGG